jgi:hypothetical protein
MTTDVLVLEDWGMSGIDTQPRADLLEIIDDRAASKATIITSQLPIEHWHACMGGWVTPRLRTPCSIASCEKITVLPSPVTQCVKNQKPKTKNRQKEEKNEPIVTDTPTI